MVIYGDMTIDVLKQVFVGSKFKPFVDKFVCNISRIDSY